MGRVVTNGGDYGASGGHRLLRDPRAIAALAFVPAGLLYMVVNAVSMIDLRGALGRPIAAWQAWVHEGTSFVAWCMLLPVILALAMRLLRRPLLAAAVGLVAGFLAVSWAHTVLMTAMRVVAYAFSGQDYAPTEPGSGRLLFEARKDVITYTSILAVFLLARQFITRPSATPPLSFGQKALIEVRDGSRVVMLCPEEIDWVSAAANYVELHGSFGSELARRTMTDVESELKAYGFVRVHRSRLVRRTAIASIETRQSGDFDIVLRSGAAIRGSRRFRQNLTEVDSKAAGV